MKTTAVLLSLVASSVAQQDEPNIGGADRTGGLAGNGGVDRTGGSAPDCTTAADCEEACEKTDSPFTDKSLCPNLQCVNKKCSTPSSGCTTAETKTSKCEFSY